MLGKYKISIDPNLEIKKNKKVQFYIILYPNKN